MPLLTEPIKLDIQQVHLSDEQFYQLCIHNPDLRIERSAKGELLVRTPGGGESGNREIELGGELYIWNKRTQLGKVFNSSTLFELPGGGRRSPDVSWVELSRWEALTADQRQRFPAIAPDFVMELRSRTDDLPTLQEKMQEYMDSGVRLGWLINPQDQQGEIYRTGQSVEVRSLPSELSGEEVLPEFVLSVPLFDE